ncbi:hypothetical protein CYL21_0952 [Plasmodium falciparum NF54]|uniref:Uncharacterized protein n=2 Tax=Plasmodium falciparum TaxID=5833 RepID=Q8I2L7_PLAF7|nr:conserved Plasmodium protein, unknown function [Plasmodium falciparum 3D7]KAF4330580.1 hypothetical protein CYL21_0952 [Plasmodium falciparum NF54]PKC45269.1 hypothetical protein CK202_4263 [Plasmodium falciparum NF54]CAD51974.1 conserved Plasmodium protein, unknown function [Plasmodium falciparum 3D7]|eukprot:XP_001352163.1 conserved Plasmodium protein, unknown function [Plasmodium falciparum 3D7]
MEKIQEIIHEFVNIRSRLRRHKNKKKNEEDRVFIYSNEGNYYYEKRNLYNLYIIIKCYYYLLTHSIKHEKWKIKYKEEKQQKCEKKKLVVEEEKEILLKKRIQKQYVHKIKNYIIMNRHIHAFKFLLEKYVYMNKYNDPINEKKIEIKIKKRRQKQNKRKRNIRISIDKNVLFNKFISYIQQFIYDMLVTNDITYHMCSNNIFFSFFQKIQMNKYELSNDGNNMKNSSQLTIITKNEKKTKRKKKKKRKKKEITNLLYKNNNHMFYNDLNSQYYYNSFMLKTIDPNLLYLIDNDFDLIKILFFFQVPHLFIMYVYIITCDKNKNNSNYYHNMYHKFYMSLLFKIINAFYSSFILTYNKLVSNKDLIILFKIFSNILKKNHILLFKWLRCYEPIYKKLNERDKKNKKQNEPHNNNMHPIKSVDKKGSFSFHHLKGAYPSNVKKIKEHEKTKQEDVPKKYISQGTYLIDCEYEDRNRLNKVNTEKGDKYKIGCSKELEGVNLLLHKKDGMNFAFLKDGSFLYRNLFNYFKGNEGGKKENEEKKKENEGKKKENDCTTCDDSNICNYESMCDKDNDSDGNNICDSNSNNSNSSDSYNNYNSNYNYNVGDFIFHQYVKGEDEIDCINFTINVINNQDDNIRFYKSYIKEHIDSMFLSKYNLKVAKKFGSTLNDESKKKKKRTKDQNNTENNNTSIFDNYKELVQNFFLVKKVFMNTNK